MTTAALALTALLASVVAPAPASASTAPLLTEHGIGIRLDETALTGPALAEIETALQPFVDQLILEGAADGPFPSATDIVVSSNLELSLDFLVPGGSRPSGGLTVHADIRDIEIEFKHNPWWPWAPCSVWVRPDDATVDITGAVDKGELPSTPIVIDDITATWDDDPNVSSNGVCWWYIFVQAISDWWNGIWDSSDPESTAAKIERMLEDSAQDLLDGLWADYVAPVLDDLEGFGVTVNLLHTDDHGLIITGDVDATGGVTIPEFGGPFDVSGTVDSGVDTDVEDLLANRTSADGDSHLIVSIHPNVVNQFMNAFHQRFNGNFGVIDPTVSIESVLLDPSVHGSYSDTGWALATTTQAPTFTMPTGPGGAPQLQMPEVRLQIRNTSWFFGLQPVAVFQGSVEAIDLVTEVRAGSSEWGPAFDPAGASASLTLTQANAHVQAFGPDPADMLPYVKQAVQHLNDNLFTPFLTLAPIEIGSLNIELCTTCGRYDGDERYTETLKVT